MSEALIFEKVVDKSALSDGITIPETYQSLLFNHLDRKLEHGESMPIVIQLNGLEYHVNLYNLAFNTNKYPNHHDIVQIRYSKNSPFATALRLAFTATNTKIEEHLSNGKPIRKLNIPTKEQEYILLYASEKSNTILLDLVTVKDINKEIDQYAALPEKMIENILITDDTTEMSETMRYSKIRKMNHAIGNSLKVLYSYRCQICGAFIGELYGSYIIHTHHIDYFSRSLNNDAANIMIVCPNHHAIIHDTNPIFNHKYKTYKYPNGLIEGLRLNIHL